jgi:hypothetical protein
LRRQNWVSLRGKPNFSPFFSADFQFSAPKKTSHAPTMPRGQRSTSQSTDAFAGIPAELKAFRDGWTELTLSDRAFSVVMEEDFSESYHAQILRDTLLNMANRITVALQSRGQALSEESILKYMLGSSCSKIYDYTTQTLTARELPYLSSEFEQRGGISAFDIRYTNAAALRPPPLKDSLRRSCAWLLT